MSIYLLPYYAAKVGAVCAFKVTMVLLRFVGMLVLLALLLTLGPVTRALRARRSSRR